MDAAELSQKYPELLADIRQEAAAQASLEAKNAAFALVAAVAGEETAEKVREIDAAGVTPAQLAALAPLLASHAQHAKEDSAADREAASREKLLSAITHAHSLPLPSGAEVYKSSKSALVADAERRAAAQRM